MAGHTDFIALYQELELNSGCTFEEFRQAYRKRVGDPASGSSGCR